LKIAIIDTGIDDKALYPNIKMQFIVDDNNTVIRSRAVDTNGHGTAVTNIIHRKNPTADLIIFQICEDEISTNLEKLISVLEFIMVECTVDVVNMSCGVTYIDNYKKLSQICDCLFLKGIMLVSAFDNDGAISYPASLSSVIGVDVVNDYSIHEIQVQNNSIVNVLVPQKYYRTTWIHNKKVILTGNSFACAEITGMLSNFIDKGISECEIDFCKLLKGLAVTKSNQLHSYSPNFKINKAIILPYNKEVDAIIRYNDCLTFELLGVFDFRLKGHVGKVINNIEIKPFEEIGWDSDFDTVVLSHIKEFESITGENIKKDLFHKAVTYGKNVYSFDPTDTGNSTSIFYPKINRYDLPEYAYSKLRKISLPCVGVFGTSSKQGKFSLQMELIRSLKKLGYKVGSIMTEPSGYLFGADFVFPMGYNSTVDLNLYEYITCLNDQMWQIEKKEKDIVIVGCQSGTIHYDNSNLNQFAISQYGFLLGTNPDVFILCINAFDESEYIGRTIRYLNSMGQGKVIALAILPIVREQTLSGLPFKSRRMSQSEINRLKERIRKQFRLPIYTIGTTDIVELVGQIVNFFGSE